jgi:hypothetical protein
MVDNSKSGAISLKNDGKAGINSNGQWIIKN